VPLKIVQLFKDMKSLNIFLFQITTPLMIMIGNDDRRCPPKQSYEMYKALKARNKKVR